MEKNINATTEKAAKKNLEAMPVSPEESFLETASEYSHIMRKSESMGVFIPLIMRILGFGLNIFLLRNTLHKCGKLVIDVP